MSYDGGDDGYDSGDDGTEVGDTGDHESENATESSDAELSGEMTEVSDELMPAEGEIKSTETTESLESAEPGKTEENIQETTETAESDEIDEETKAEIAEKSSYSQEVNDYIHSVEELEVYQKAGLHEQEVDGRICLVRDDIDMDYVDEKSGMTNRELMEKGRAPIDAKTGERIELHHIGQEYDSPLAELTTSEHDTNVLHTKSTESWRNDSEKNNHYNNTQRPNHWKARA